VLTNGHSADIDSPELILVNSPKLNGHVNSSDKLDNENMNESSENKLENENNKENENNVQGEEDVILNIVLENGHDIKKKKKLKKTAKAHKVLSTKIKSTKLSIELPSKMKQKAKKETHDKAWEKVQLLMNQMENQKNGRRISFDLSKNVAQDFNDSLNVSPVLPYNPKKMPSKSILATTEHLKSPKKKLFKSSTPNKIKKKKNKEICS